MENKNKLRGLWLVVIGAALMALALEMLSWHQPSVLQYAAVAPAETNADAAGAGMDAAGAVAGMTAPQTGSVLKGLVVSWNKAADGALGDTLTARSVCARDYGCSFTGTGDVTATATLTAVGENWFSVYPRYLLSGRLMSAEELAKGARVIVLDEPLAFKLFPTTDPLEGKVKVGEAWYRVIGVVRYSRGVGEYERYEAYIPLACAAGDAMQTDIVEVSGVPAPRSGASRAFREIAGEWLAGGTFMDSDKEIMRASILPRVLAVVFGFYLLLMLLRALNRRVRTFVGETRARLRLEYLRAMLPGPFPRLVLFALGYAALAGAAYGLLALMIGPMYVFTEWIPDVLVEMSSITERFWQLTAAAAQPVVVRTREYVEIRFWAGVLRWGTVVLLAGGVVMALSARPKSGRD